MNKNKKKFIAPIVITVIMILYYVVYFGFFIFLLGDSIWKYILGIVPLVFAAVTVSVCIERIKEIRKGEEDDIGKY